MINRDKPIESQEQLYFGFDEYADVMARSITDLQVQPPITMLIDGGFGCGKTTLMRRIQQNIEQKSEEHYRKEGSCEYNCSPPDIRLCKTFWFDAWKNQDEEELEKVFYYQLIKSAGSKIKWQLCAKGLRNAFDALEFKWIIKIPKPRLPLKHPGKERDVHYSFFSTKQMTL